MQKTPVVRDFILCFLTILLLGHVFRLSYRDLAVASNKKENGVDAPDGVIIT